ncbi:MAG: hypothetical protein K6G94_00330 [Kiritimatiellae bacterium]|nr:hypothetical protein [Kiritimatiellia bacterium]
MSPEVIQLVFDALHKGRLMRQAQREYFRSRTTTALSVSKEAETAFDVALDEAAYAVKHGSPRPTQQSLAI